MRAILCVEDGPPERLVLCDLPEPVPGAGEVRVRMCYAGVNFPDTLQIANRHQNSKAHPFIPGLEGSGKIDLVGDEVEGFAPGDAVVVYTDIGTFAESVVAPASAVVRIGREVDLALAAAFPVTYGTTHHAYRQRAQLAAGEQVLVLGAGGGTGLAAVELARVMGARVIAAASSPEKLAAARRAGAEVTIDYTKKDLREALRSLVGKRGVNVVYDPVGGELSEAAFRSLAWNGRHLVVGFAAGEIPRLPLNLPLLKGAAAVGVFWGEFIRREPELHRSNFEELFAWLAQGRLSPQICARYSLERTAEALRHVMERRATGKVLIELA